MHRCSRPGRLVLAIAVTAVVVLGACSGGGSKPASTTSAPVGNETSTTSAPVGSETSTTTAPTTTAPGSTGVTGRFDGGPAASTNSFLCLSVTTADGRKYWFRNDDQSLVLQEAAENAIYLDADAPPDSDVAVLAGDPKLVRTGDTITIAGEATPPDLYAVCGPGAGGFVNATVRKP